MKWYVWALFYNIYGIIRVCDALKIISISIILKLYIGVLLITSFFLMGIGDRWTWINRTMLMRKKTLFCMILSAFILSVISFFL